MYSSEIIVIFVIRIHENNYKYDILDFFKDAERISDTPPNETSQYSAEQKKRVFNDSKFGRLKQENAKIYCVKV